MSLHLILNHVCDGHAPSAFYRLVDRQVREILGGCFLAPREKCESDTEDGWKIVLPEDEPLTVTGDDYQGQYSWTW